MTQTAQGRGMMSWGRIRLAWRYLCGTLTADEAQGMLLELRFVAGWEPIVTLSVEDVLTDFRAVYEPCLRMEDYALDAIVYVGQKADYSDTLSAARDWALDVMEERMRGDGLLLVHKDGG